MPVRRVRPRNPRKRRARAMKKGAPSYFGWRYIWWIIWSKAITILMIVQAAFTTLTLDPTLVPHNVFHWLLIANAMMVAVLAQIKREVPAHVKTRSKK